MLQTQVGYDHSLTYGSAQNAEVIMGFKPLQNTDLYGGVRASTTEQYNFLVRVDYKWEYEKYKILSLSNRYIYSTFSANNMQNLNASLTAFYNRKYFTWAFGAYFQFFTPIEMYYNAERTYIWESAFIYDLSARIFPQEHPWNIACQITNMRDFLLERPYSPNFIIKGNYAVSKKISLLAQIGMQPSGIFHIAANYYRSFFNIGVICTL